MSIIFKYVWRNILEKKLRTALILFSIAMSSALLFASLAIGDTLADLYTKMITSASGQTELSIKAKKQSDTEFVNPKLALQLSEHVAYSVGAYMGVGTYSPAKDQSVTVELKGYDLKELANFNPFDLLAPQQLSQFSGKQIVINSSAAKRYGLVLKDRIQIKINGENHWFTIVGIAAPKGPFYENGRTFNTVVPRETLASLNGGRSKSNVVYIKLKDKERTAEAITALSQIYRKCDVKEAYTKTELKKYVNQVTMPFVMMTTVVLFMSVFIIYTSFKVITLERLPVIGTFRSIGSSKKETDFVLVAEAFAYGLFGGIVGTAIGFGILAAMAYILQNGDTSNMTLIWKWYQIAAGMILAVGISLASAIIPIVQVAKISVKDIVLNNYEKAHHEHKWKKPFGFLLLVLGVVMPPFAPLEIVVGVCLASFLCVCFSATIVIPVFTKFVVKLCQPLFEKVFGNIGILAAKNLLDNKSILTNITLLAIGMSGILMIQSVSNSVQLEVGKAYKDFNFEVWCNVADANNTIVQSIRSTSGVKDVMPTYAVHQVEVASSNNKRLSVIRGIDTTKYTDFYNVPLKADVLKQLENGRNIVLGDVNRVTLGVKLGDTIVFKTDNGDRPYKIIGFMETLIDNGKWGLISTKHIKMDFGVSKFDDIYVKTGEPDAVAERIKIKLNQKDPYVETKANLERLNSTSNSQIFSILSGFSGLAMLIGVFGVLNNLLISFIQRKRSIAVFKSVGMSQKQVFQMVMIEAMASGLIGGIGGIIMALLFLYIIPFLLPAMAGPIPMHYDPMLFISAMVVGMLITFIATIGPGVKSSKLNIIDAIKYE